MKVLVTGGAGYIGSHAAKALVDAGHKVIILDNFSNSPKQQPLHVPYIEANITDKQELTKALKNVEFDAVMNFAAKIEVADSMKNPEDYYHTNVQGVLNILRCMKEKGCSTIIFSSTAAVYGIPDSYPITEEFPLQPINTYGRTKRVAEDMIIDFVRAYRFSAVILRYFNASGASTDNTLGECHLHETHVIPLLIEATERQTLFKVFGTDYPTADGTAVRDYVHVMDIADAHVRALETYHNKGTYEVFNIGTEKGYSVKELISVTNEITGKSVNIEYQSRREGDPPILVASNNKLKEKLGWEPQYSDLKTIINTAYFWYKKQNKVR